ncbi:cytochrome b/b6 domain-containing protein [Roseibium sp. HPY-6]|uniref:cytochrome b n=1 Tax=Roseibium sp. HPY-6 TaxID=3229852 RepID=UPI00338D880F
MNGTGSFSRTLHWFIAVLGLAALCSGFLMTRSGTLSPIAMQLHIGLGALAGFLSLIRVLLWLVKGAPEQRFPVHSKIQAVSANMVHGLLRLVPLALLASGAAMIALSGSFPVIVSGKLVDLRVFAELPPRNLHHGAAICLAGLIGLHVAAALWHWRREASLEKP